MKISAPPGASNTAYIPGEVAKLVNFHALGVLTSAHCSSLCASTYAKLASSPEIVPWPATAIFWLAVSKSCTKLAIVISVAIPLPKTVK